MNTNVPAEKTCKIIIHLGWGLGLYVSYIPMKYHTFL